MNDEEINKRSKARYSNGVGVKRIRAHGGDKHER